MPSVSDTDWNDTANSDPIADVEAALTLYQSHIGVRLHKLTISRSAFNALRVHPLIVDRLKHTDGPAALTPALLAQIFDVDHVRILD